LQVLPSKFRPGEETAVDKPPANEGYRSLVAGYPLSPHGINIAKLFRNNLAMIRKTFYCLLALAMVNTAIAQDSLNLQRDTTSVQSDSTLVESTPVMHQAFGDETPGPVYRLKPAVDIPLTLVTAGWSTYAFTKIYSKDPSTPQQIQNLRIEDINGFDRWGADVYSDKAAHSSDFFFYGAMPLPLVLLADKDIRRDAPKVGFLYLQAMSVTGLLYTGAVYFKDRYRPLAYNPQVPMDERLNGGAKNSFFAGHVALVATSSFFTAKVFSDYNPHSRLRWVFYAVAATATAGTGWLRHRGGKHFPSDILIGTTVGTLSGILVPHFHKNKDPQRKGLSLMPFTGRSHGIAAVYRF
jgi:membrane-associated phospholipid phosphatase